MTIAIVDDELETRQYMQGLVAQYLAETGRMAQLVFYPDGASFLVGCEHPDIVLMDIDMPGMDGLSTAEQLRRSHPDAILIFTTRLSQCAIRGYEVDAIRFLGNHIQGFRFKPVTLPGLTVKLNKAFKRVEYRQSKICLKTKDSILFLGKNEIYYAEGSNHHVIYHTAQGEFPVRSSLQEAEEQLGAEFSRSSHSYIANLGFVTMVGKNDVTVRGEAIPLSRAMRRDFLNAVNRYYGVR
mgnify:CR=1 FL=1